MNSSELDQTSLTHLRNSPWLWLLLFSGFGLITLRMGQEAIESRMQKNQQVWKYQLEQEARQIRGEGESEMKSPTFELPAPYRVDGLKWLLAGLATAGLVGSVFAFRAGFRNSASGSG